ncbi:MAG: hypothetical protein DMD91_32295 [Candidatus Rokuibacteriota bacterium]|nr:MAG: hypothetical protein DMD91_32295 [Candidatus Rokubacteria bacterium]
MAHDERILKHEEQMEGLETRAPGWIDSVMRIVDAVTQPQQRLDGWMRRGTELDNEALQHRVKSADAHAHRATETARELEREITRLHAEIDDFEI